MAATEGGTNTLVSECFSLLCPGATANPSTVNSSFSFHSKEDLEQAVCSFVTTVRLAAVSLMAHGISSLKAKAVIIAPELLTACLKMSSISHLNACLLKMTYEQ